jgi:hypothetical protein
MLFGFGEHDSPVENIQFLHIPKQRPAPRDTSHRESGSGAAALSPTTGRQSHVDAVTDTEHAPRMASTQKRWLAAAVVVMVGAGLVASVLVDPVVAEIADPPFDEFVIVSVGVVHDLRGAKSR